MKKPLKIAAFTPVLFCSLFVQGQTIQWLKFPIDTVAPGNSFLQPNPSGANAAGTWVVTNLGCYGRVLVTQTSPVGATDFVNPNFQNVPASGGGKFVNMPPGVGPFSWGPCGDMNFYDPNARDNYNINFYFLDGDPGFTNVVVASLGLGHTSVATVSQSVVFQGEYHLPGGAYTCVTNQPYNILTTAGSTNAGTIGTIIGSHYNVDTNGDILNTSFGMFQPVGTLQTTNLPTGSAGFPTSASPVTYLSLAVDQEQGDGMGFTLGYFCASNVNCLQVQCPNNVVATTCSSNCTTVNFAATATNLCCTNGNPQVGYSLNGVAINTNYCFPVGVSQVDVTAFDACGDSNTCSFTVTVLETNQASVEGPTNIVVYSCTNVTVDYPQPLVTESCCTNWNVVFNPPSGSSFAAGKASLVNWSVYDCSGTNAAFTGSFWVYVYCSNCCNGPLTNYTVTVVTGSNYLADSLCQGTSNTLADVLPVVPDGTDVYFWNPPAGQFSTSDTFTGGSWQNGTEPMYPGEGFLLVNFTNQYSLTIYGSEPGCGGGCTPLTCNSDTLLLGDVGLNPNPVDICSLICCAPPSGTEVQAWNAINQSFTDYTFNDSSGGGWLPTTPPPLPVGYSEFISMNTSAPVINCPNNIFTNSCTNIPVYFNVTASNEFGGTLTATANPASGSYFVVNKPTTVNCAVTNSCGKFSLCSFTVTVTCPTNSPPPVIHSGTSPAGGGSVIFTWQPGTGYILESNYHVLNPTSWVPVLGNPDGFYSNTMDKAATGVFFRLKYQVIP